VSRVEKGKGSSKLLSEKKIKGAKRGRTTVGFDLAFRSSQELGRKGGNDQKDMRKKRNVPHKTRRSMRLRNKKEKGEKGYLSAREEKNGSHV